VTSCDLEEQLVRESEDMLEILFLIIGCICGLSGILFAFEWIMSGRHIKITKESKNEDASKTQLDKNFEKELAIGLCFFFCFYVGAEMTFSNFIYSFGICHLKMSRDSATVLTTTFWVLFTVFRFLSAIQARYMSAAQMLWSSLIGCALSLGALYFFTESWIVFTATGFFGASMSNCFATGFLFAQNFLEVTGKLATIFIFGAAIGWAVLPSLAGFVLEQSPQFLPIVVLGAILINMIDMFIITTRGKNYLQKKKVLEETFLLSEK